MRTMATQLMACPQADSTRQPFASMIYGGIMRMEEGVFRALRQQIGDLVQLGVDRTEDLQCRQVCVMFYYYIVCLLRFTFPLSFDFKPVMK